MSVTLSCKMVVREMRKELNFTVVRLTERNANKTMVECAFAESLESGCLFCVGAFVMNVASVAMKLFLRSIYFLKKFFIFLNFSAICKSNAAINFIIIQHKISLFPLTFTGHHYGHHHMTLQSNSGPGLTLWIFVTINFLQAWIVSPAPNPQPGGPGLRIYDPRRQDRRVIC
jgi:hypothetical protein